MTTPQKNELMALIKMLVIALLVCAGVHLSTHLMGCAATPAYAVGIHAAIASDEDLLPKTGGFSHASPTAPSASTSSRSKPPATAPEPPATSPQSPAPDQKTPGAQAPPSDATGKQSGA